MGPTVAWSFATLCSAPSMAIAKPKPHRARTESIWGNLIWTAKSEFLANMSHELRTPLNAIIGFSQMIRSEPFGPVGEPRYTEYVADIQTSGEHLLGVINDILDLSRIEAGQSIIDEQAVDLRATMDWCLAFVKHRAAASKIDLENQLDPALTLCADPRLIRQILINLLSNSVKFTAPGGACRISGNLNPDGQIEVVVTDTGIGMSAEEIPKALERFGQINNNDTNQYNEGTGLGLPLVKSLTELHGASFDLESEKGEGTSITLRFPAARTIR